MAFRIHDSVVRGEIDNRVRGIVRGKIWLEGRPEPLVLELSGYAHPDLAGCVLTFSNPQKRVVHPHLESLSLRQQGTAGDLTASRRVRVFDLPLEEALESIRRGEKPVEHMANCLYLEWYSGANGRVVIESHEYELTISPPEWRLTAEENAQRGRDAEDGMAAFLERLDQSIEAHRRRQKDPSEEWDEHDYEAFLKESDVSTEKYGELLDKYGESEEGGAIIDQKMGWNKEGDEDMVPGDAPASVEEMNQLMEEAADAPDPEPDPAREGIDWIRIGDGRLRHPLQHRCSECARKYSQQAEQVGRHGQGEGEEGARDPDLEHFVGEFQITAAKLAGALNGIARGAPVADNAFVVAYLKRALNHLHQSQAGLTAVASRRLLAEEVIADARRDLFEIREQLLRLMDERRGR